MSASDALPCCRPPGESQRQQCAPARHQHSASGGTGDRHPNWWTMMGPAPVAPQRLSIDPARNVQYVEGDGNSSADLKTHVFPNEVVLLPNSAPRRSRRMGGDEDERPQNSGKSSDRSPPTDLCPHMTCTSWITRRSRDTHCRCISERRRQAPHQFPSVTKIKGTRGMKGSVRESRGRHCG